MALPSPISELVPEDAEFTLLAMDGMVRWLNRWPNTREEYDQATRAKADFDIARERLRIWLKDRS